MKHKQHLIVYSLLFLSLLAVIWSPAAAQEGTAELRSDADYVYGQTMRFRLRSGDIGPIDRLTLYFRPNTSPDSFSVELPRPDGPGIDANYSLDLVQNKLAPFSTVAYWWELERADGVRLRVPEQLINYVDDQFSWQNLSKTAEVGGGRLSVHWTGDDPIIGVTGLALVEEMIPRLGALLPLDQIMPFDTYIYPSSADLASAMRLAGLDYEPGRSYPELGALLTTAVNPTTAEEDLRRGLSQEMTELLLYQALGNDYVNIPVWLRSGLADVAAGEQSEQLTALLEEALRNDTIIPLSDLCVAGPESFADPNLFYAESSSLLRFMQSKYGDQAVSEVVAATGSGEACATALENATGKPLDRIERAWLWAIGRNDPQRQTAGQTLGLFLLLAGGFALAGLLVVRPRQASRRRR